MMFTMPVDEQVSLGLVEKRHAGQLFALIDRNRDRHRQWLRWSTTVTDVDGVRERIAALLREYAETGCFCAFILEHGRAVGLIYHAHCDIPNSMVGIAYWIDADSEGRGLVTRAVEAVTRHSIERMGMRRVEIVCDEQNTRSQAIPQRLGFTREGVIRAAYTMPDGRAVNAVIYGMLDTDWKASQ